MIETGRLLLRPWRDTDVAPFVAATNTPAVMVHLGGVAPDGGAILETVARQQRYQREAGHCMWIVERRADAALLGFCGVQPGRVGPTVGRIEIGWRLREDAWGRGYAREAAAAALAWSWATVPVDEVIAITVPANRASWGLMERLGMRRREDLDFGHPAFAADHPLHRHIVYMAERA